MKRFVLVSALVACSFSLAVLSGCPPSGGLRAGQTRTFDGIQYQWCPPGSFAMGSPTGETGRGNDETLHEVTLTNGFWLSTREITQAQWEDVTGATPSTFVGDNRPVEQVSWNDIQEFLILLNATTSGGTYRLPTEAEWEYAYRAGTTTRFHWGNDAGETAIANYAWTSANSGDETHSVGGKRANAWGLRDMSGNVNEWCHDKYGTYSAGPVTDPMGTNALDIRAFRGGSWDYNPVYCRAATRDWNSPDTQEDDIGFRLLRTQN